MKGTTTFFSACRGASRATPTSLPSRTPFCSKLLWPRSLALAGFLDRFIIMDDVELADVTGTRSGLSTTGPNAASLLKQIDLPAEDLGALEVRTLSWRSNDVAVLHAYSPLVPRFELWADAATIATLGKSLVDAVGILCESQSQEWLRILEGTPLYGTDIRDRELPQETDQTRALHFAKGCYLGQEIVERIRSRGNVHRGFGAFRLQGELPSVGSTIEVDGKQVGELTSVAAVPLPGASDEPVQIGLVYIRREALDRGLPLHYSGGVAVAAPIPFLTAAALTLKAASKNS